MSAYSILKVKTLQENIKKNFAFSYTKEQASLVDELVDFTIDISTRKIFLIKGYAGTGKTSLIAALVKSLPSINQRAVLLAPTGRAAKVLGKYAKKNASTIHRKIYWIKTNKKGNTYIKIKENTHTNTLFIVDEASMIPDAVDKGFGNRALLDDLISYVYDGIGCKLVLIGDTAQLPPVHLEISPALDEDFLHANFNKEIICKELTEVVRQMQESMILENATIIRDQINNEDFSLPQINTNYEVYDIKSGDELQHCLEDSYNGDGLSNTIVLCRSNKRAGIYNQQIRSRIRYYDEEIATGDYLMVVRNNYFWLDEKSSTGFIANGDIIEVIRFKEVIHKYGFEFAKVTVQLIDYPDEPELDVIVLLNVLNSPNAALTYEEYKEFHQQVTRAYKGEIDINKKIKADPYFNALQVKFSYAITCHKSQGGQWENVFIDLGYFKREMMDKNYLRWLYTAMTRASKKLFLINFSPEFFK